MPLWGEVDQHTLRPVESFRTLVAINAPCAGRHNQRACYTHQRLQMKFHTVVDALCTPLVFHTCGMQDRRSLLPSLGLICPGYCRPCSAVVRVQLPSKFLGMRKRASYNYPRPVVESTIVCARIVLKPGTVDDGGKRSLNRLW